MTNALLFFRDQGSRKWLDAQANTQPSNFFDPSDLPPFQQLEFDLPEDLLESVSMIYENNIKDAPVSNPEGVRKINVQDNGLQQLVLTFRGRFRDEAFDIITIQRFARQLQVEGVFHQFGIYGFKASADELPSSAVSTPFNFDPTDTFGLTIKKFSLARVGNAPKNFDFEITLTSGGVLEQL